MTLRVSYFEMSIMLLHHAKLNICGLVFATLCATTDGQVPVCSFPARTSSGMTMTLKAIAYVNSNAVLGSIPSYSVDSNAVSYMGSSTTKNGSVGPNLSLDYNIMLYHPSTSPDRVNVNVTLTLTLIDPSGGNISSAKMEVDLGNSLLAIWDAGVPLGAIRTGRSNVTYTTGPLTKSGDSQTIHFLAEPDGIGGTKLPEGKTEYFAHVSVISGRTTYTVFEPSICLERVTIIHSNIFYQQGFTALAFFIMLFAGIGLAILGVYLFLMIRQRRRDAIVSPWKSEDKKMKDKSNKIVMDAKAAMKRGGNAIKDFSLMEWDDSIVFILAMKDKLHMFREIDNLDILSTINVDTELETEQNDAAIQASLLLVQGLRQNQDISKSSEDKVNTKFQKQLKDLDKKLDVNYRNDLESIYKDIEGKNKEKLGDLLKKHRQDRQDVLQVVKDMPDMQKKQMLDLMEQQQHTEYNEVTYKLALEQNEKAEKLRKEYSIRKRMGIKELQGYYMDDVIKEGDLNAQKADWLIKQHKEQQEQIHRLYDDEVSRQRINLEEKLARRRALAQASETQEDDKTELLNAIAAVQLTFVSKLRRSSHLTEDQIDAYMNQARLDLEQVKNKMDKEGDLKNQYMFKHLSGIKRKKLADTINKNTVELQNYIAQNKAQQSEGPVDPVSYVNGLVNLKSHQRKELTTLENQLDEAHAKEFETTRDECAENAQQELKEMERILIEKLKSDGLESDELKNILKAHELSVTEMTKRQMANRKNQEAKLKDELARRKREWEERRAQERKEQQELRNHETVVVEQLLSSQVSISEADRDQVLKEHEKQMVKLENSLTMNKLRQKRMLEEKIAQKKARQMAELEQKQSAEINRHRKIAENNGEEDDEETHQKELMLMKKHAQQKIALIQGQELNIEEEMEEIRIEMNKERALTLKDQEERFGALITSLQMEKAREMSQIEEQQKAINNLKGNIMDDLNTRGILSTSECQKILSIHKEERENLSKKVDGERSRQEKMLRARLAERLQQRENLLVQKQETEMQRMLEHTTNKSSAKIKRMLLMHKQVVEMETFRNKLEREISQSMEDTKRNFEMQKQKIVQEREMQFVAGLVKVGDFNKNELTDVLHMLFPGKTEEAIGEILNKVYDGSNQKKDVSEASQSTLADRVYISQYGNPTPIHKRGSVMSMMTTTTKSSNEKKLSKKSSKSNLIQNTYENEYSSYNEMPGSSEYDKYYDDDTVDYVGMGVGATNYQQPSNLSGTLPPLRDQGEVRGKKRKKGLLKKLARHDEDDETL